MARWTSRCKPQRDVTAWAVICTIGKARAVVPHLVFDTEKEAARAQRKRERHPNSIALGAIHEIGPVRFSGTRWVEVTP